MAKNVSRGNQFNYHDEKVGNFVFNYIRNITNAKKVIKFMRSPKDLERFLLTGKDFANIVGIAEIDSLYMSLKTSSNIVYGSTNDTGASNEQADKLKQEIAKKERALERLNKLFLYDEEAMSEAEYIVTKNKLRGDILTLHEKLVELNAPATSASDDAFILNASNFILMKVFEADDYIDFVDLVALVDKPALRDFTLSTISKITTNNSHITSIEFANGSIHHFAYK